MDYSKFFNEVGSRRDGSVIRSLAEALHKKNSDVLSLAGGVPNPNNFPCETATIELKDGTTLKLDSATMTSAQQYSQAPGYPELINLLKGMIKKYHNPPLFDQMEFLIASGSQDGMFAFFENMIREGDYVIVQEPTYPGFYSVLRPHNARYIAVNYDEEGMCADDLRRQLSRWRPGSNDSHAPKVMYVNPTGANPSGVTFSLRRKQQLYKIAQEYDLMIFEDDAYYFLPFTEGRIPSFLSLDTDGRVLRTDTFSKVVAPGWRLGFVSGPKPIVEKMEKFVHASTQMPPAISQNEIQADALRSCLLQYFLVEPSSEKLLQRKQKAASTMLLYKLLLQWGDDGFEAHTKKCAAFYKKQRDAMLESANKWLTGLAEWNTPAGGLFLWMKILGVADVDKMLMTRAVQNGVLTVPGRHCTANPEIPSAYVRLAFCTIPPPELDKAIQRLAAAIREEQLASAARTA